MNILCLLLLTSFLLFLVRHCQLQGQAYAQVAGHEGQHDEGVDDSLFGGLLGQLVAFVIIGQYKLEDSVKEVTAEIKA